MAHDRDLLCGRILEQPVEKGAHAVPDLPATLALIGPRVGIPPESLGVVEPGLDLGVVEPFEGAEVSFPQDRVDEELEAETIRERPGRVERATEVAGVDRLDWPVREPLRELARLFLAARGEWDVAVALDAPARIPLGLAVSDEVQRRHVPDASCRIGNVAPMPRSYVHEARRRVGPKKARIRPIIERLKAAHPDAGIALRSRNDLELLVAVMLSAQTTDVNVNKVTDALFAKYRRPEDYLAVQPAELERDIFATGFFRQKTKALRGTMMMLIEEFDGRVPDDFDDLLRLPGVARKTANVVSAERGRPVGIVVDTHVRRLSQRLRLTRREDPVKIEQDLIRLVPREEWAIFPHLLIWHGRRVCIARRPLCEQCVLTDLCPSSRV